MSVLSLSESNLISRMLKNPDKDFEKIIALIEKKIQLSEIRSKKIYNNSIEGICILDSSADITFTNQCMAEIFGYSNDEMIGKSIFSLIDEKKAKPIKKHLKNRKKGISERYVAKLSHRTGKDIYVQIKAAPFYDEHGKYDGSVAFVEDITEKQKIEQLLRVSEERFKNLYEEAPNAYFSISNNKEIIECNKEAEKLLDYSKEKLLEMSVFDLYSDAENGLPKARRLFQRFLKGDIIRDEELIMKKSDGTPVWVGLSVSPVFDDKGNIIESRSTCMDITKRKLAEDKLKESEQRYRDVIQDQTDLIVRWRTNGILTFVNESYCNFFQKNREELIGTSFLPLIPDEDHDLVKQNFSLISLKNPIMSHEHRVFKPDGTLACIHWMNRAIFDEKNNIIEYQAVGRDITGRMQAEQNLKESEKKYRILFDNSPIGIGLSTIDGKALTMNRALENIIGYTIEEYKKINIEETYADPNQRKLMIKLLEEFRNIRDFEVILKRKDSTEFVALLNIDLIVLSGEDFLLSNIRDITQVKNAEQKLIESEEKYRSLFENSPVALMDQDLSDIKKYVDHLKASGINDFNRYFDENPSDLLKIMALSKIKDANRKTIELYEAKNKEDFMLKMKQLSENIDQSMTAELLLYNKMEILSLINGKTMHNSEIETKTFKGKPLFLYAETSVMSGFENTWSNVIVSIVDVTTRKKIEETLKHSEEKFRTIIENAKEGYFEVDLKGNFTFFNRAFYKLLKYSQDELIGRNYKEIMIEASIDRTYKAFNEVFSTRKEIPSLEYTLVNKKGDIVYGLTSVSLRYNSDGSITGFSGFMRDITDMKKAEEALLREYDFNKNLIQASPAYYVAINAEGRTILVNDVMLKALGYNLDEVLNEDYLTKFVPERERTSLMEIFKKLQQSHESTLNRNHILTKEGQELLVEWHGRPVFKNNGKFDYFFGFGLDITEQAKAERKLKESEKKYRNFLENFQGIAFQGNLDYTPIFFHGKVEEITGYEEKDFISQNPRWDQIIFDEDKDMLVNSFKRIHDIPDSVIEREYRIITKDGERKWLHEIISNVSDENEKPYIVQGIINEITDRKKTEQALKASEEKYRNLVETSSMGLLEIDFSTKMLAYINPKLLEIMGYKYEELVQENSFQNFIYHEDLNKIDPTNKDQKLEFRIVTKDGKIKWLSGDRVHFYDEDRNLINIRLWLQDITEKKEIEEIKTNLLVRFSHEFKTPLISIKGFSDFILEEYRDKLSEKIVSFLENIKNGADKLTSLTNSFLESSQLDGNLVKVKIKQINVLKLVNRVLKGLEGIIKLRHHVIDLKIEENLTISGDPEKLHIVLSNLVLNASKYTPKGGLITISSTTENGFAVISVKDNGIGLTQNDIQNLFKPFGKIERYGQGLDVVTEGMGMGLFITKELVELHKGKIWAESTGRNKGSNFIFKIPIIQ